MTEFEVRFRVFEKLVSSDTEKTVGDACAYAVISRHISDAILYANFDEAYKLIKPKGTEE